MGYTAQAVDDIDSRAAAFYDMTPEKLAEALRELVVGLHTEIGRINKALGGLPRGVIVSAVISELINVARPLPDRGEELIKMLEATLASYYEGVPRCGGSSSAS